MKKTTLNQIVDFKINLISSQQILSLTIKRVLLILVFSISFVNMSAQNSSSITPTVMDVNAFISSLKTTPQSNQRTKVSVSNSQYVENLVFGIQPAQYFDSGSIKTFGDIPVKLFTNISSLNGIPNSNILTADIEIVVIKVNNAFDMNSKIDLIKFSDFPKLKYIYMLTSVNTTDQKIASMFLNYTDQYSIFYKIEIAE
jgi:hypothetical protein